MSDKVARTVCHPLFLVGESLLPLLFYLAYLRDIRLTGITNDYTGLAVAAALLLTVFCLILLFCPHATAALPTLFLVCATVLPCYDSAAFFLPMAPLALPVVACLAVHRLLYNPRKRAARVGGGRELCVADAPLRRRLGPSFYGMLAVSAALLLGGVGHISPAEYFAPAALYSTLGGAVGLPLFYLWLLPEAEADRSGFARGLLRALLPAGLLCGGMLFCALWYTYVLREGGAAVNLLSFRNNACTMMLFALPVPFFLARSSARGAALLPLLSFGMYGVMLGSGSRGGALCGGLLLLLLCLTHAVQDARRRRYGSLLLVVAAAAVFVFVMLALDARFSLLARLENFSFQAVAGETRGILLRRAFERLPQTPLFGIGFGSLDNADVLMVKRGGINWYHTMVGQVVGSLGLLGCLCYGLQLFLRARVLWRNRRADPDAVCCLGFCYLGLLLMTQVNPGEFCPVPYAMIAVWLFLAGEHVGQTHPAA